MTEDFDKAPDVIQQQRVEFCLVSNKTAQIKRATGFLERVNRKTKPKWGKGQRGQGKRGGKGGLARAPSKPPRPRDSREGQGSGPRWENSCRAKSPHRVLGIPHCRRSIRLSCMDYFHFPGILYSGLRGGKSRPPVRGSAESVIGGRAKKPAKSFEGNASLGGSWFLPRLGQEAAEPINRQ